MKITLTIPDDKITKVVNAICEKCHYEAKTLINGVLVTNPETKAQFAKRMIIKQIIDVVEEIDRRSYYKAFTEDKINIS